MTTSSPAHPRSSSDPDFSHPLEPNADQVGHIADQLTAERDELRQLLAKTTLQRDASRSELAAMRARVRNMERATVWLVKWIRASRHERNKELEQVRSQFPYRLGQALTQARSPRRVFSLPAQILRDWREANRSTPAPPTAAQSQIFTLGDQLVTHPGRLSRIKRLTGPAFTLRGLVVGSLVLERPRLHAVYHHLDRDGQSVSGGAPNRVSLEIDENGAFELAIITPAGAHAIDFGFETNRGDVAYVRTLSCEGDADQGEGSSGGRSADAPDLTAEVELAARSAADVGSEIARCALKIEDPLIRAAAVRRLEMTLARSSPLAALVATAELREKDASAAGTAAAALVEMRAHNELLSFGRVQQIYAEEASPAVAAGLYPRPAARKVTLLGINGLARLGRSDEALQAIDALEPDSAGRSLALEELRGRLLMNRDPAAAIEIFKNLAENARSPSAPAAMILAELLCQQGDYDEALSVLEETAELTSRGDLLLGMANVHARMGQTASRDALVGQYFARQGLVSPYGAGSSPRPTARADGPLVSVVMTTFNSADHLERAANSVLVQTHANLELFIVDDVSADTTRDIISQLAERDDRVRPIYLERNGGTYVAKNTAILQAQGDFVTCHDSDDEWHPLHLERHLGWMDEAPNLVATKSAWVRAREDGLFSLKRWGAYTHENPASTFFRRNVLDEIGYFDSVRTGADTEFWNRLKARYGPACVRYFKETLAVGLHHDQSLTTSGAAAMDDEGVSLVRLRYCESWAQWQANRVQSNQELFIPFPLDARRFPEPPEIAVVRSSV